MSRIIFSFGTKPPPNTPDRAKRRKINTDSTSRIGGVRDTLKWGGSDTDRMKLRRVKTPQMNLMSSHREAAYLDPPQRGISIGDPDFTTYIPSWGMTIPNKTENLFSMKDTLHCREFPNSRERHARSLSPMRLTDYGDIPGGLERQRSNALIKQMKQHKRPGVLDTINAADHAIKHIQAQRDREEESYDNVIDYHRKRYDHVINATNPSYHPERFLDVPVNSFEDDLPSANPGEQSWNKDNWKSSMSRKYRKDYEDILDNHMAVKQNSTSGVMRNFYKDAENGLATKTDLRRYHHVI